MGTSDADCASGPCDICPATVELCLAPLAPVASLAAGACKVALPPLHFSSSPTCGPVGTYAVSMEPLGIAFDGANMWVTSAFSDNVTKLSPTGATVGTYAVGDGPAGIAIDGTNMWVVAEMSVTKLALGTAPCPGTCTNTNFDRDNCGACGAFCLPTQICNDAICQCPTRWTSCGAGTDFRCWDLSTTNPFNLCGNCDTLCAVGQPCVGGVCGSCPTGLTDVCPGEGDLQICTDTQMGADPPLISIPYATGIMRLAS